MDKKKIEYLKNQIGFHLDDLTPRRRAELATYTYLSSEWKYAALARKTASHWNTVGFGLFNTPSFIQQINDYLANIDAMSEDELFPKPRATTDFNTFGIVKVIDVTELLTYPKKVWEWIDDTHIRSKVTKKVFEVVGGKDTYDKYVTGELGKKIPDTRYYFDKKLNMWCRKV